MKQTDNKFFDRGTKMVMNALSISYEEANELLLEHGSVRQAIDMPVVVGFGIANADQAKKISENADGVVIGSALVKIIEKAKTSEQLHQELSQFTAAIRDGLS